MRRDKKKVLSGVLAAGLALSCLAGPALAAGMEPQAPTVQVAAVNQESLTFSDVPTTHWAYPYIMTCVQKGAIAGTTTPVNGVGMFDPEGKVSLGQFITVLIRLIAADEADEKINSGAYSGAGVHWATVNYDVATEIGLIYSYEYSSSDADLEKQLTREEMAVLLTRAAAITGDPLDILPGIENNIGDLEKVSPDKVDAVMRAYSNGLLAGTNDNGDFAPKDTMTRAEMATVVCRLMNYYPRGEVTIKDPDANVEELRSKYVVTESVETQGMLRPAVSREYELKALGATKIGEDADGVYVIFTAPQLPSEIANDFTFVFTSRVYKSNGDYFADPIRAELKSGETSQKIYFNSYSFSKVTKSEIGSMSVGTYIYANGDISKSMFTRSIYSDYPTTANATWYDGAYDYAEFDSSAVWAGLGL